MRPGTTRVFGAERGITLIGSQQGSTDKLDHGPTVASIRRRRYRGAGVRRRGTHLAQSVAVFPVHRRPIPRRHGCSNNNSVKLKRIIGSSRVVVVRYEVYNRSESVTDP